MRDWAPCALADVRGMGQKWNTTTSVRLRDWQERIDDTDEAESDITISIVDRVETILNLRDVQDLAVPRSYAV